MPPSHRTLALGVWGNLHSWVDLAKCCESCKFVMLLLRVNEWRILLFQAYVVKTQVNIL